MGGDLEVGTGAGDDGVIVSGYVGGLMRIFTSGGHDRVRIGPSLIGEAVIDTGAGNDSVETYGAAVLYGTFVSTGDGSDLVTFVANFDDPQYPIPTTFDGVLYLDTGAEVDDVQFDRMSVSQFCQVDLGTGANGLSIDDSTFDGDCTFRTQESGGELNIESISQSPGATSFNGGVAVEFAGGDHVANIGNGTPESAVAFNQAAFFFSDEPISTIFLNLPTDPFLAELFLFGWEIAP